jgi:TonB-linked SusC/RagA family outer membrane protein
MHMRKALMLVLGLFLLCTQLLAQNRTLSGRITDVNGNPVPNASVVVKGSKTGTTTDGNGFYSISVPANAKVLIVSSVSFEETEFSVASGNVVNGTLKSAEAALQEVVVVGYGTGRKVGTVVGNVSTVNAEKIQDRPTANAFDALQGKVPGLQVFTSNGEPSSVSSIRLHGVGSLGASSTPLFVMDGVPIDQGTVISLNPNDFETVSVLKDASATSIYGSRAANGVIFITTKRGSTNRPATITLQTQYGQSSLATTDYFENFMNTKELTDFWVASGYRTQAQVDALLTQYPNDTKWYKTYYKDNAPMYQADISVSGGGGKTSYYLSAGYLNQDGLAYRSGFERYTLRSNLNSTVNNWLRLGVNVFAGTDERETNPYGTNSTNRGLALLAAPFYSPKDKDGNDYYGLIPGWARYHPKYLADKVQGTDNNVQFNPSGYIQLNPVKNLTLKSQGGVEAYDYTASTVQLPSYLGSLNNGSVSEALTRGVTKTITNTAEYKFNVAQQHNFTALLGHEFIDSRTKSFSTSSTGQTDDRLVLLSNGPNNRTATSSISEYAYLSYFSRLDYNLKNKYYFDASFRQDQASRFGKDNRTANFWAVGTMWKVKQEDFLNNLNWLTDLTVRASVGTTGNSSIGNYQSLPLVGTNTYDNATGWGVSAAGNDLLSWESQLKTTVGANFSLFNKIRFDVSYYNRVTKNMLIAVPFAYTSGFSSITTNVGSLKNTGFDVAIDADIIKTKKAYLTPYVNFNYNKNEVTELFQGKDYWIIPNTGVSWAVGQPVSYFYPVFAGVNAQTGNPEWYQPNTDPSQIVNARKDPNAVTSNFSTSALEQSTGIERYPPFNGGFGLNSGYDGFTLSADFSFSKGKYLINNDRYFFENPTAFPGFNQSRTILDYWKKPGDVATFPRYGVQFTQFDSRLIEDASFLRLKALTIGYNVSNSVLNRTNFFKGAKVYVTGRNLWTLTKYTGPDPEVDSNLTLGVNPNTKQIAFGLDFTF